MVKFLWLLLESCIGEGLFESNPLHKKRVLQGSSRHLLDTDHVQWQIFIQRQNSVDNNRGKEVLLMADQLRVQAGSCASDEKVPFLPFVLTRDINGPLLQLLDCQSRRFPVALDDDLRMNTLLDVLLGLLQELTGQHYDTCCSISSLIVLRLRNVNHRLRSRMHNIQSLHDRCAIVGDDNLAISVDELVHAARSQGCSDDISNSSDSIDVGD
mmetsp:Transcript_23519/g.52863  ORF Transcript_23519/g.52863 Transcript_23519/m.52863 type:complete len:212 (+) Transcript_23519:411-1046(+)